jgi:polyhydroxybutyrate depolymerase
MPTPTPLGTVEAGGETTTAHVSALLIDVFRRRRPRRRSHRASAACLSKPRQRFSKQLAQKQAPGPKRPGGHPESTALFASMGAPALTRTGSIAGKLAGARAGTTSRPRGSLRTTWPPIVLLLWALAGLLLAHATPAATPPDGTATTPEAALRRPLPAGDHERTVWIGTTRRSYRVHVPPRPTAAPRPVVLLFHGGGGNGEQLQRASGFDAVADRVGALAVYPQGSGRFADLATWNAGNCCAYAAEQGIDDVAYVRALLDDLGRATPIDRRRIYATGMSNGGMLAHRLGCELADRITAIAAVAGTLGIADCRPSRPVPILHVHGTADTHVPFTGGVGEQSLVAVDFRSVAETLALWRTANRCPDAAPVRSLLPDRSDDGMRTTREAWGPCAAGSAVELLAVEGGGHSWPGHVSRPRKRAETTRDFDVNEEIWAFVSRFAIGDPP